MKQLTTEQRFAIFRQLVAAQDAGESVRNSRWRLATKHGVSVHEIVGIEDEGIAAGWLEDVPSQLTGGA